MVWAGMDGNGLAWAGIDGYSKNGLMAWYGLVHFGLEFLLFFRYFSMDLLQCNDVKTKSTHWQLESKVKYNISHFQLGTYEIKIVHVICLLSD